MQACLANYMDYRKDFDMSNSSYGFRKNRRCELAIIKGLELMNDGYDWIVDIDLSKFFDTVDQDRLIRLVDNTFKNRDVTALTRKFITAGVSVDGTVEKRRSEYHRADHFHQYSQTYTWIKRTKNLKREG